MLEIHLPAVGAACPPQSQQQRKEMPLPAVGSPAMGAASPSQFPQQRKERLLPQVGPPAMGAAYSSHPQPQRREMLLPEVDMLAPPVAETSPTVTPATALPGEPLSTASLSAASPYAAAPNAASRSLLLQTADIPPETARLIRCHNPWPAEDVLFCPNDTLPAFVTSIPALSSGPELWIAIHNHRPEPLQPHLGQNISVLEVVTLADAPPTASQPGPPRRPPLPERLAPLQQQQLNDLFREFSDVFSQVEDDLGSTLLLEHMIETHGPLLRQPYRQQNPAVRREEMVQVQQMLASDVIRPSNSPRASPVVIVRKKDGSLRLTTKRGYHQRRSPIAQDRRPPRRSPWGSMVFDPRP